MNSNIKEEVFKSISIYGINTTVEVYRGIVSQSTIYKWVKENRSLSYTYNKEKCQREWLRVCELEGSYNARPIYNKITLTYQPHFFHIEQKLYKDKKIKETLIKNRTQYLLKNKFTEKELLRGFKISGIHIGYSHFSPLWVKKFITDYSVTSIYDPCGGWGHRLIGATASKCNYIYNDLWTKSANGACKINKFIGGNATIYNQDCTSFTPTENYEAIFTCPPYYNVETYQSTFKNIEEYNLFIRQMFNNACKSSVKYIGVVINSTYKHNIINNIPSKFKLIQEEVLGSTSIISHFNKTRSFKQEILLIFAHIE